MIRHAGAIVIFFAQFFGSSVVAQEQNLVAAFVEGEHYKQLPIPVDTANPGRIEVAEVFSYMCVHCFNFDPYIEAWHGNQTDDVAFVRVPASFSADWELLAQAYYSAETLGVTDQVHVPIFEGLHQKGTDLRKTDELSTLFQELAEVSDEDFRAAYNSFSVRSRVQQAKALTRAFQVTGVPTLVVNGKYVVDGRMAGGNVAMLQVVDFLVARERAALGADGAGAATRTD